MEKNNFENYEFLPANVPETEQFFMVQDDGTILVNRPVQYVTQVQNVKDVLSDVQSCTVFDVSSQQFLVNMNNSSDIITVPDQLILPHGHNNLYTNNYILPATTPTEQMVVDDSVEKYSAQTQELLHLDAVGQSDKEANSPTEITLTDDQFKMLEQKGWVLLEKDDKIYLLDTLGLHDITTNNDMINKLKGDGLVNYNEGITNRDAQSQNATGNISKVDVQLLDDTASFVINDEEIIRNENTNSLPFEIKTYVDIEAYKQEDEECETIVSAKYNINSSLTLDETHNHVDSSDARVFVIGNDDITRDGSTLKLKTKFSLQNFPERIVLGRTMNGKRLVAKVVKPQQGHENFNVQNENEHSQLNLKQNWEVEKTIPSIHLGNILNENEFLALIQSFSKSNMNKCSIEDVITIDSVISQLLQIPAFKTTVMNSNLVVTKTVNNDGYAGKTKSREVNAVVTGRVYYSAGRWHFTHVPSMLQNMVTEAEKTRSKKWRTPTADECNESFSVLHVQITESKRSSTNIVKVSVSVNKRSIPKNLITKLLQQQQPSTIYACTACALLFESETLLNKHQEASIKEDSVCKTRQKTLLEAEPETDEAKIDTEPKTATYKCTMCPQVCSYPSSLSKHILAKHIKYLYHDKINGV